MENPRSEAENGGDAPYLKIESMATWVGTSLASAFFSSLERFSCINLSTSDQDDEIDEESNDRPLVLSAQNSSNYCDDYPVFAPKLSPVRRKRDVCSMSESGKLEEEDDEDAGVII